MRESSCGISFALHCSTCVQLKLCTLISHTADSSYYQSCIECKTVNGIQELDGCVVRDGTTMTEPTPAPRKNDAVQSHLQHQPSSPALQPHSHITASLGCSTNQLRARRRLLPSAVYMPPQPSESLPSSNAFSLLRPPPRPSLKPSFVLYAVHAGLAPSIVVSFVHSRSHSASLSLSLSLTRSLSLGASHSLSLFQSV